MSTRPYDIARPRGDLRRIPFWTVRRTAVRTRSTGDIVRKAGIGRCPTGRADRNRDGFVSVTEGHPFYGHTATSLTTRGDTSPASGLAIKRFPTAPFGSVVYRRTVAVDARTAAAITHHNAVLVVHGVDRDRSGAYDGRVKSDLDPSLPMEATAPAACGPLRSY
jgi:hypothetical protein